MKTVFIIAAAVIVVIAAVVMISLWYSRRTVTDKPGMEGNSYTRISQEEARRMMAKNDGHVVVDVRRQDEFDGGHIPGAICIPNESIGTEKPAELPDLEQIILVYCRSGRRSKEAAQKLFDVGYKRVYEFGGILDWTGEITPPKSAETIEPLRSTCVLVVTVGDKIFYAHLKDNASAKAFIEKLNSEPLTLSMRDYGGFEKVADLPWKLPAADERITTAPGDIVLYQGDQITIYYGENTWDLTRLGRIESRLEELKAALGAGDATVTMHLEWSE